jgi:hypothetical protein
MSIKANASAKANASTKANVFARNIDALVFNHFFPLIEHPAKALLGPPSRRRDHCSAYSNEND